ncbi:ribbon-helix-helix protein, CopG family [Puniceicoccus vermicola]|uniref:Ribbon-helix-helix protein, CopG family n=1 Tax=Puniceicoccus vermicola TaxID=388746 RepID=A0A7X1E3P7_9BACT|nr:ribbon-helix-helix protein, CopG family [Puniceicoccus vermicola]MBC2601204.1 ribbon-helix-helix protein, CopG family [Puniceicoccus vermicola]
MQSSITTSIRLSPRLRKALELRAKREGRGKNWVISQALESYLESSDVDELAAEARRQSILASSRSTEDWTVGADWEDWK